MSPPHAVPLWGVSLEAFLCAHLLDGEEVRAGAHEREALDLRDEAQRIFKCCAGGLVGLFKDAFYRRGSTCGGAEAVLETNGNEWDGRDVPCKVAIVVCL